MRFIAEKPKKDLNVDIYFAAEPEGTSISPKYENAVREAVRATLLYEAFSADAEVSVTFCDGPYIRELNATYREKDAETDVLSFPMYEADEEVPLDGEAVLLGDIVLNLDRAGTQAAELGHSTLREVAFLTVHSTLHLLGYDHELSEEDEEDMCRRQREIMKDLVIILAEEEN